MRLKVNTDFQGDTQIRTEDQRFAIFCLTPWPYRQSMNLIQFNCLADSELNETDGTRTRNFRLDRAVL